ncbi:MAG: asparagine synthase-related protein [Bacteroidales bacterium]|jgi:asparagine synthase (glutamine-hydrolysing)|nr:asparagine synthase-related protein [Bacteroidales bacterium]
MQSYFGKINLNNNSVNQEDVVGALKELSPGKNLNQSMICNHHYGLGAIEIFPAKHRNTKHSPFKSGAYIILEDCRIDNRETLIRKLNLDSKSITDPELILQCFQRWKADCPKYLTGDFSFAIWNTETHELFCARDHFGVKPLNYYLDDHQFIFSTEIRGILSQQNLDLTIDQQFIADTLSIIKSDHSRSTYQGIRKLPPAHSLHLKNKELTLRRYWELKPAYTSCKDEEEYIRRFKELLNQAVQRRLEDPVNYGAELSGGIDSSSIASLASRRVTLKTFSHVMPDEMIGKVHPFNDEKKYIRLLNDFCNINQRFLITSENSGIIQALENSLLLNQGIVQQNFSVFSDQLYQEAENQNVQVLLSGFGGDEVVTSKAGNYLREILKEREFKTDLKAQGLPTIAIHLTKFKYWLKNNFPQATNLLLALIKGKKWWARKYKNLAIQKSFNRQFNIKQRYINYYQSIRRDNLTEQSTERITHPHVAQRLEYSSLAAKHHGIEYRYPLLDKDLIEFYLSMPQRLKAKNGVLRYTIRQAMDGYLPEEIQWRDDKSGATIPTVFMRTLIDKNKIFRIMERAKSNPAITRYIDMHKYQQWSTRFFQRSAKNKFINPGAFFNYLKLILFIENNPSLFK